MHKKTLSGSPAFLFPVFDIFIAIEKLSASAGPKLLTTTPYPKVSYSYEYTYIYIEIYI